MNTDETSYAEMWDDFAKAKASAYLSDKYSVHNLVGLTGLSREYEILRLLDISRDEQFLDVGCASGRQVIAAALIGAHGVGIDIGSPFIAAAQSAALERGLHNTRFVVSDASPIPYPADSYDKLLCSEVLEHVPDASRLCAELYRVLKPGGTAVLTVPNWNSRGTLWRRLCNAFRPFPFSPLVDYSTQGIKSHGDAHLRQYTLKTFSAFVQSCGFRIDYLGGASFIDGPKMSGIIRLVNQTRVGCSVTTMTERLLARVPALRCLGRHIVVRARKPIQ